MLFHSPNGFLYRIHLVTFIARLFITILITLGFIYSETCGQMCFSLTVSAPPLILLLDRGVACNPSYPLLSCMAIHTTTVTGEGVYIITAVSMTISCSFILLNSLGLFET